jgi:hypothetical protein
MISYKKRVVGLLCFSAGLFVCLPDQASADLAQALQGLHGGVSFAMTGYSMYDAGTNEEWGILEITQVLAGKQVIWSNNTPNDQIYGMVYGLNLINYFQNSDKTWTFEMGQTGNTVPGFTFYETNYKVNMLVQGPSGRTGTDTYSDGTHAIGGKVLFQGNFESGITADAQTLVLENVADPLPPTTGNDWGYGSVTGGMISSDLDYTNIIDPFGGLHDMYFSMQLSPDQAANQQGWIESLACEVYTDPPPNQTPEPSTAFLFAAGLSGLAYMRNRLRKPA